MKRTEERGETGIAIWREGRKQQYLDDLSVWTCLFIQNAASPTLQQQKRNDHNFHASDYDLAFESNSSIMFKLQHKVANDMVSKV